MRVLLWAFGFVLMMVALPFAVVQVIWGMGSVMAKRFDDYMNNLVDRIIP